MWGVTTWGNDPPCFDVDRMAYMKTVKHLCPTTERVHYHAFIIMKNRSRMRAVKQAVCLGPGVHCKPLRKNDTSYLDDGHDALEEPKEYGERYNEQGKRNDIHAFKLALDEGMSVQRLSEEHFACWLKYSKMIMEYRLLHYDYSSKYRKEDFKWQIKKWDVQYHFWGNPDTGLF